MWQPMDIDIMPKPVRSILPAGQRSELGQLQGIFELWLGFSLNLKAMEY